MTTAADPLAAFLEAATCHGTLERAEAILAAHAELAGSSLHAAAVLGDDAAVRRLLALDPASVTATAPPYGGDALNYLCLSKYLRHDPTRSDGFLRAAAALLDAGARPNPDRAPTHDPASARLHFSSYPVVFDAQSSTTTPDSSRTITA